jgi:hypothetical protein
VRFCLGLLKIQITQVSLVRALTRYKLILSN